MDSTQIRKKSAVGTVAMGMLFAAWLYSADATAQESAATVTGRIAERNDVAKQSRFVISRDYTQAMGGLLGLLLADLTGTAAHSQYVIHTESGRTLYLAAKEVFGVNTCVSITAPAASIEKGFVELGQAGLQPIPECAALKETVIPPIAESDEIKEKPGRPN
ncbi:hypothetical protein ACEN8I_13365 [Polaromonas sp. CT11-55]|uniref:hypothetical protein n=1 Tax=Polaromonas sp. CT11-55 TaxID=3243045 RepID=UPI0039A485AF